MLQKLRTKILTFQKRALRLIFLGDCKSHAIPFFISSPPLPSDVLLWCTTHQTTRHFLVKIYNLFTHQADIHHYETRSSLRGDYFLRCQRIDIQGNYFSKVSDKIWNSLSCELRWVSKPNFQNNVHDILLQRQLEHDDYIYVLKTLVNFDFCHVVIYLLIYVI